MTNWDGKGPVFNPYGQVRVFDDWKEKTVTEKSKNKTDGVIESKMKTEV